MNGAHDMGGRQGFGTVVAEANEPVFHAPWEKRVYGLAGTLGAHDLWNLDEDRHACENLPPQRYLNSSYYEIWLQMFEKLLVEKGAVTRAELKSGKSSNGRVTKPLLKPKDVFAAQIAPGSYHRDIGSNPAYIVGQKVRVKNMMTPTHTRLPGYLRGAVGEVVIIHGCHVFPDTHSLGRGEDPHWLYAVRFTAKAVWGRDEKQLIHADLWEPYLEAA
jgi:nitrile hydratase subunit beta